MSVLKLKWRPEESYAAWLEEFRSIPASSEVRFVGSSYAKLDMVLPKCWCAEGTDVLTDNLGLASRSRLGVGDSVDVTMHSQPVHQGFLQREFRVC